MSPSLLVPITMVALLSSAPVAKCFAPPRLVVQDRTRRLLSKEADDFGMEMAFAQLNELESIDATFEIDTADMEKAIMGIDLTTDTLSPEEELKLYQELYQDLDQDSNALVETVKNEIGEKFMQRSDKETPTLGDRNQDDFMNQALEQAMREIQAEAPGAADLAHAIRHDKDLMKEIEAIFDNGNNELLASLEDIRKEQNMLAQASAERTAKRVEAAMAVDQDRMEAARISMSRIIGNVKNEEIEVQQAVAELQKAQSELNNDPLMKLFNMKQGGVVKQGAFVGAMLFGFRSAIETVAMLGLDGESHTTAALIQGALALSCALYFFVF